MADPNQTIIIKKIKKGGHGHHGGAWKVAYADFVTAMMAFFLLLWLLNAATKEQLEGIADYFTPTIGIKDSQGIGVKGGVTQTEVGKMKDDLTPPGVVIGRIQQGPIPEEQTKDAIEESDEDSKLFEKAEDDIRQAIESDPNLRDITDNILMEQTPEGLKITVADMDKQPMFNPGQLDLSDFGKAVMRKIGQIVRLMPNHISVTGHTDASPMNNDGYTNWELSADRANATRRYLIQTGVQRERIQKVVGMADRELLVPFNPHEARNRRVEIILLRGSALKKRLDQSVAPRSMLSDPRLDEQKEEDIKLPSPAEPQPKALSDQEERQGLDEADKAFIKNIINRPEPEEPKPEQPVPPQAPAKPGSLDVSPRSILNPAGAR